MSDKHESNDSGFSALSGHAVIALSGRDALAFAQAQFMNDLAALADGHWQWNGWLTPKGRLVALFAALRLDAQTLWLVLPDADAAEIARQLQRFVFRSKVVVELREDLQPAGRQGAPTIASGALLAGNQADGVELDMGGAGGARTLRLHANAQPTDADADARWRAFDLAHGLPRLDAAQAGRWTPQQLSLERLRAFSVKKGCYPGQEIVARTHFLGQAKRALVRLRCGPAAAAGMPVLRDGQPLGELVCVADATGEALAVLPLERGEGPLQLEADGGPVELQVLPLLGGLERPA